MLVTPPVTTLRHPLAAVTRLCGAAALHAGGGTVEAVLLLRVGNNGSGLAYRASCIRFLFCIAQRCSDLALA